MAYIKLTNTQTPGISGLLQTYIETAKPLCELAERLLRIDSHNLSKFERELLASYVSYLNKCVFCSESHGAVANYYSENQLAQKIWENPSSSLVNEKMQHILTMGSKIQREAKSITEADIQKCRDFHLSDDEINDVCLIASAFCMYNRYVDSLGTQCPPSGSPAYVEMGKMLAEQGYMRARN